MAKTNLTTTGKPRPPPAKKLSTAQKGKGLAKPKAKAPAKTKPKPKRATGGIVIRSSPPPSPVSASSSSSSSSSDDFRLVGESSRSQARLAVIPHSGAAETRRPPPLTEEITAADAKMQTLLTQHENYEVLAPIYPDHAALSKLKVMDEISNYLRASDMHYILMDDPGTYPRLVKEFMASFSATKEDIEGSRKYNGKREQTVSSWTFRLGGQIFTLPALDICTAFGCTELGESPRFRERERYHFWVDLAAKDIVFTSPQPATMITSPVWRLIHRIIATSIHSRKDGGRYVNTSDLDLMLLISRGESVNIVDALTVQFESYQRLEYKGRALGGGTFITLLAKRLGLSFDRCTALPKKALNLETLRKMHMIEAKTLRWIIRPDVPQHLEKRMERKRKEYGFPSIETPPRQASEPPMPAAAAPAAHTSAPVPDSRPSPAAIPPVEPEPIAREGLALLSARLDSLSDSHTTLIRSHEVLSTLVLDFVAWQGNVMVRMAASMGISDLPPPPAPFSQPPPQPTMPTTAGSDSLSAMFEGRVDGGNVEGAPGAGSGNQGNEV